MYPDNNNSDNLSSTSKKIFDYSTRWGADRSANSNSAIAVSANSNSAIAVSAKCSFRKIQIPQSAVSAKFEYRNCGFRKI
jgi:hypothetical protein